MNIVAREKESGALIDSYQGAYFEVTYDSTYLSWKGNNPGWSFKPTTNGTPVTQETATATNTLVYWDTTAKTGIEGVITSLTFKANKSNPKDSFREDTYVTVTKADLYAGGMESAFIPVLYESTTDTADCVYIARQQNTWTTEPCVIDSTANPTRAYTGYDVTKVQEGVNNYCAGVPKFPNPLPNSIPEVKFYKKSGEVYETSALNSAPKDVGEYKAVFTVAETDDYTGLTKEIEFSITKANATAVTDGVAKTNLIYTGAQIALLNHDVTAKGVTVYGIQDDVTLTNIKYTLKGKTFTGWENVKSNLPAAEQAYVIDFTAESADPNYLGVSGSFSVTIKNPDYHVATTQFVSDYTMVFVYTTAEAHFTCEGNAMYDVTDLGYKFVDGEDGKGTVVTNSSRQVPTGEKVYALLLPTDDVTTDEFNNLAPNILVVSKAKKTAGIVTMSSVAKGGAKDVNNSRVVDMADAVAVVATYNRDASVFGERMSNYMLTILRTDVNRDGSVQIVAPGTDNTVYGDALLIKNAIMNITDNTTGNE